ncbi:hypothetical protein HK102_008718, partial [Quaeritorhiza haematococci]
KPDVPAAPQQSLTSRVWNYLKKSKKKAPTPPTRAPTYRQKRAEQQQEYTGKRWCCRDKELKELAQLRQLDTYKPRYMASTAAYLSKIKSRIFGEHDTRKPEYTKPTAASVKKMRGKWRRLPASSKRPMRFGLQFDIEPRCMLPTARFLERIRLFKVKAITENGEPTPCKLRDPHTLQVRSTTKPHRSRTLNTTSTTSIHTLHTNRTALKWSNLLKLIFIHITTHTELMTTLLICRRVCKSWRYAVDTFARVQYGIVVRRVPTVPRAVGSATTTTTATTTMTTTRAKPKVRDVKARRPSGSGTTSPTSPASASASASASSKTVGVKRPALPKVPVSKKRPAPSHDHEEGWELVKNPKPTSKRPTTVTVNKSKPVDRDYIKRETKKRGVDATNNNTMRGTSKPVKSRVDTKRSDTKTKRLSTGADKNKSNNASVAGGAGGDFDKDTQLCLKILSTTRASSNKTKNKSGGGVLSKRVEEKPANVREGKASSNTTTTTSSTTTSTMAPPAPAQLQVEKLDQVETEDEAQTDKEWETAAYEVIEADWNRWLEEYTSVEEEG